MRQLRPRIQMVFQDPIASLNPRRTIRQILEQPLRIWNRGTAAERYATVRAALEAVGMDAQATLDRRPHQLSGGQCQRISIARALVLDPDLLVCDEPVSALDVSVQAQILKLIEDVKRRYQLSVLFISHDLAVVRSVSDRVAVMYLGRLCEIGDADRVLSHPAHHYTAALLAASPVPDPNERSPEYTLGVDVPSPSDPPSGCRFRTRCPAAQAICGLEVPRMQQVGDDHLVSCHFPLRHETSSS
jgi:peptide/nickel transport system ATP-binding protein